MMSGIRGKNTKPEMLIRTGLHRMGFRFRLHDRKLPGAPDLVFPGLDAVILVHGCFWHGHACHLFKWPSSRAEFWRDKLQGNVVRDRRNREELRRQGWRVGEIWECQLKGRDAVPVGEVLDRLADFLRGSAERCVIGVDQTVAAFDNR